MKRLRIAMVGYRFMGRVHAHAYRTVHHFFPDCPEPELELLVGRDEAALRQAAQQLGFKRWSTDWRAAVADPEIDVVDISSTGNNHCEVALAAAAAKKHVICEKPLANTLVEAREMLRAVESAGVTHMTAFNYRRVPAVSFARRMIEEGRLGKIYHFRARYLQDWILDPQFPLVWRLQADQAGSGPHGDLNAHLIDLSRYLVGEIESVCGMKETFIHERPTVDGKGRGKVSVEDAALFLARFQCGALGSFEATRFAAGRKNHLTFEINGEHGSLEFDLERLNELRFFSNEDRGTERGFRRIYVTEGAHPYVAAWWPPGHILGYEHTFTHEVLDFLRAVRDGRGVAPDFRDGLRCQAVLDAVLHSTETGSWVRPEA
jgi:predicted dehydrogenase